MILYNKNGKVLAKDNITENSTHYILNGETYFDKNTVFLADLEFTGDDIKNYTYIDGVLEIVDERSNWKKYDVFDIRKIMSKYGAIDEDSQLFISLMTNLDGSDDVLSEIIENTEDTTIKNNLKKLKMVIKTMHTDFMRRNYVCPADDEFALMVNGLYSTISVIGELFMNQDCYDELMALEKYN